MAKAETRLGGRLVALITVCSFALAAGRGFAEAPADTPVPTATVEATPALNSGAPYIPAYADGARAGEADATNTGAMGWGVGGCCAGAACGVLGCLGVSGAGLLVDPPVITDSTKSPDYITGYQQAYKQRVKRRRATAAFIGGTVGAVIAIAGYFAIVAANKPTPTPT